MLESPLLAPKKSGEYVATLTDGFGLQSRSPDSTFIKVRPDAVPQVTVTEPAKDLQLLPGEEAAVTIEVRDEFGIHPLMLAERKVTGRNAEGDVPAVVETGPWVRKAVQEGSLRCRALVGTARLDIAGLGLVPGDCLEYQAEAADFAGDEVQRRGTSALWRVTILSETKHMEMIENKLRELQAELLQRAAEQRTEAAKVAGLQAKAAKDTVSGEALEAKDREAGVQNATEDTARKFEALMPDVARNPSAPPETMAELGRLASAVKSVAGGEMASAEKSLGEAAQGKPGEQTPSVQKAETSEKDAAQRLEDLANATERLARNNALGKLAGDAERLAARQRDLKQTTEGLAPKTAGRNRDELSKEEAANVDRLADAEKSIQKGIEDLAKDIEKTVGSLAYSSPSEAEAAQQAGDKLQADKTSEKASGLAGQMQKNALFSSLPAHDQIADALSEIAKQLKAAGESSDPMEQVTKEIEQFAARQREINGDVESAIKKPDPKVSPLAQGDKQSGLGRDVSEEATALKELADEIENFSSKTAEALKKAAGEMKDGAGDLYDSKMPEGLEHGKKALEYLTEAQNDVIEDGGAGGMGGAQQNRKDMAAMLLLLKTISAQKKINRDTSGAAQERITDTDVFNHKMNDLAGRQSGTRQDARKLEEMAGDDPAAEQIALAGRKMDSSRLALAAGDPGPETRKVQAQILGILEQFLSSRKPPRGGSSGQGMGLAQIDADDDGRRARSDPRRVLRRRERPACAGQHRPRGQRRMAEDARPVRGPPERGLAGEHPGAVPRSPEFVLRPPQKGAAAMRTRFLLAGLALAALVTAVTLAATACGASPAARKTNQGKVTPEIERAVVRGLDFLQRTQKPDGSWSDRPNGQVSGVVGMALIAMLAHGEVPDDSKYGRVIRRAADYIVTTQDPSNGLLSGAAAAARCTATASPRWPWPRSTGRRTIRAWARP